MDYPSGSTTEQAAPPQPTAGPPAGFASGLLTGRTVLVTGASSGIGELTARRLAAAGARTILLARSEQELHTLAKDITEAGGAAAAAPADLADAAALERAVRGAEELLGPVDLLAHSAGWAHGQVFLCEQTEQQWTSTIDVNLNGAFRICRLVVPGMMERRSGGIVLVSSIAGSRGLPSNTAYCAAKFGLHGLMYALAAELGPFDIRVNAVAPGLTRAPGTTDPTRYADEFMASLARHHGPADLDWSRYLTRAVRSTALRRLVEPDEVSNAVLYLLSDLSTGVTGQILGVDAGVL
ncbi:SDR family NAD(P)-dependent oxidoreductase [Catenulispora rubra]|uniref:SDR family NAD(P)-dependent oxidoreductase n=1 Tax=Catenulispora rubra TaxID=280293 RepID=UPI00189279F3|nr:SDR family NAD(P)-dependent oxidoreductase [Catenulispora rubra]